MDLVFPMVTGIYEGAYANRQLRLIVIHRSLALMYVIRLVLQHIVDYWGHVVGVRMEYRMRK